MIVGNDAYGNYVHDDIERIRYYFPFSQQFIEDALGNTDDGIRLNGNNRKHIILFTAYISIFTAENFPVELLNYMLQNNYNQFRDNGLIEFVKGIFGEPF